jgi:hypothetical protein
MRNQRFYLSGRDISIMGVSTKNVVLYGYEVEYDEMKDKAEELYKNNMGLRDSKEGELVVVLDGRGGRYCYIGYLIACSNDDRHDGRADFDERIEVNEDKYEDRVGLEKLAHDYDIETEGQPSIHIFSHYT